MKIASKDKILKLIQILKVRRIRTNENRSGEIKPDAQNGRELLLRTAAAWLPGPAGLAADIALDRKGTMRRASDRLEMETEKLRGLVRTNFRS